ncbi:MAG: 3,4-dihydroxy-2-butanone-4-phosphate synthase [Gammaproteobacteria bacterium]|nr:3,4-dihydroxy-2-butanone-4-phosphate synthase [Gammaproteobacteria bacterium]
MSSKFDSVENLLADIRAGKMVVVLDDEDRENEGDLIMAAGKTTAADINFMAHYGRGLICLTLSRERCQQLRLPLMVTATDSEISTNFTLSIEAARGVTTGISAHDRAQTVKAAVAPDARPEDLRQPGHVFPIMAQPGGVLARAGHTEAGCDLARLAGFEPAAVIVEILNDDGTMARSSQLFKFARKHDLKIGTIADLIRYRLAKEESIERIHDTVVPTPFGEFSLVSYEDRVNKTVHLALVKGTPSKDSATLVRVHLQDTLRDVVGIQWESLGWPLSDAMRRISEEGSGVIIVLRSDEAPRALVERIVQGDTSDDEQRGADLRTYGIGAQILRDLGISRMRVLSAPKIMHALSGFGLEVVEYVG